MELKFTPRNIVEIENETKTPIQEVLSGFSMKTLLLLVKKGSGIGTTDQEAESKIEAYIAEGKDIIELYLDIMESLRDSGFLPRNLDTNSLRDKLKNVNTAQ